MNTRCSARRFRSSLFSAALLHSIVFSFLIFAKDDDDDDDDALLLLWFDSGLIALILLPMDEELLYPESVSPSLKGNRQVFESLR